ncbi:MAG: ketoacyl-ACP synthase III [Acidobacteriota bacterium]
MSSALHEFVLGGLAAALPESRLDNEALSARLGMDPAEIERRTGIRSRCVAGPGDTASSLGARAAHRALERAGLAPADVELLVLSTYTPDHPLCPTAPAIAHAVGAVRAGAFDVNAACSGGVTALLAASAMLGRPFGNALVVTADLTTRFVRPDDRSTAMVFGDGATATVLLPSGARGARPWRVLACELGADGAGAALFRVPDGGSAPRPVNGHPREPDLAVRMDGRAVFRFAVERGARLVGELCDRAGLEPEQVDLVVPHQANERITRALAERTGIPASRWFSNIADRGNTASSSVPLALSELLAAGRIEPGARILLVAFGAGLTWAGLAVEAGDVAGLVR